ncbi:MAG: guanylate kinase [Phycisphaerales bacterium]
MIGESLAAGMAAPGAEISGDELAQARSGPGPGGLASDTLGGMSVDDPNSARQPDAAADAAESPRATAASGGLLVVVSGPSGVGKTTIVRTLRDDLDGMLSTSATTRPQSDQERDGVDYYFLSETDFRRMIEAREFIEHAQVFGRHLYGTPRAPVDEVLARGGLVILEIDVQGGLQVRRNFPAAFMLFIDSPSEDELLRRLRARGRDDEAAIQRRFAEASHERRLARESGAYDAFIINERLETACSEACSLVQQRRSSPAPA